MLAHMLGQPGEDVALVQGSSDSAPGLVRVVFLVVSDDGRPVTRDTARVWVAEERDAEPFVETTARSESIAVPGEDDGLPSTEVYVANVRVPRAGTYWVVAQPDGAEIQALGNLVVKRKSATPPVGARAVPSRTPTLASTNGDVEKLTTADPPNRALLRHSVADSLADRAPFVLAFATPKFCTSRTCGPVVEVVDTVRRRVASPRVRWIHVEIYEDNDPQKGTNQWVDEWRLPTEPWVFVVGADGRIKAKFEGAVSVRELETAVRKHLLA